MNGWVAVLFQLFDFLIKSAVFYSQTPEGEKELQDITVAWEARANSDDAGGQVVYSAERQAVDEVIAEEQSHQPGKVHFAPPRVRK